MLRAGPAANAWRTVHGRAKLALAPALYFRKFRLVILLIVSLLFHCTNAPPRITFYRRQVCVAGHFRATSCRFGNHEKSRPKTEYAGKSGAKTTQFYGKCAATATSLLAD